MTESNEEHAVGGDHGVGKAPAGAQDPVPNPIEAGDEEREAESERPPDRGHTHIQNPTGWRTLLRVSRPRFNATHLLVGLLCALLGFAVVVQMRQTRDDDLSSLRQNELVRLLDEVTQRSGELEGRARELRLSRSDLQSGSRDTEAALEVAQKRAETQGILAGRLPVEGPGVTITIVAGGTEIRPNTMLTILEELRNAGAESVELNGIRIVASSHFVDSAYGIALDGQTLDPPYRWTAIGNPETLTPALEIPGGAMASVRNTGASGTIQGFEQVRIDAVREPSPSSYARPILPSDEE